MEEKIVTNEDIQYFRDKITTMEEEGASASALAKPRKQLELIESVAQIQQMATLKELHRQMDLIEESIKKINLNKEKK